MANERAILCGTVGDGSLPFDSRPPLRLRMWGPHRNVRLTIEDVRKAMVNAVPSLLLDLIDIAVYVYCADQAVTRGGDGVEEIGENWRRDLFFRIPVRNPGFWRGAAVLETLTSTLDTLSEDTFTFDFVQLTKDPTFEKYLQFGGTPYDGIVQEVVMFSGGVDSFGGAVQEAIVNKRRVVLVNHRSTEKLSRRHADLLSLLDEHAGEYRPLHLPVRINKAKHLGREYTQRTRSFLYVALGATVAAMLGRDRLRFYENGIVSLNLPPSPQVVGARATRTTHPQVLNGFSKILSHVVGAPFTVENPFLWKTKTDVTRLIADAGCGPLIKYSTSCTRTWETTKQHPHCGTCSQCIDRRFAILAAGQEAHDPGDAYDCDLLVGERPAGLPRTMLAAYLETANEIEKMDALQFFSRFGEASRVIRHLAGTPDANAMQIFDLHRRHAKQVTGVIDRAFAQYGPAIRKQQLSPHCLLRLVYDPGLSHHEENGSVPSQVDRDSPNPSNYIRRKGKCWAIRFDGGEERIYTPDVGFAYLHILLEHSGSTYSASELYCQMRRRTGEVTGTVSREEDFLANYESSSVGMGADAILDEEARANLGLRLAEIEDLLINANGCTSPDRLESLNTEREWITSELRKSEGRTHRPRLLGDDRNRVRNRVCNAIRRALSQIRSYDARLFEHLHKPVLNLGHTIAYVPRAGDGMVCSRRVKHLPELMLHEM